jgi:hypothetical protein
MSVRRRAGLTLFRTVGSVAVGNELPHIPRTVRQKPLATLGLDIGDATRRELCSEEHYEVVPLMEGQVVGLTLKNLFNTIAQTRITLVKITHGKNFLLEKTRSSA